MDDMFSVAPDPEGEQGEISIDLLTCNMWFIH